MLSPIRVVIDPEAVMFANPHSQSPSWSRSLAFRVIQGTLESLPSFILADLLDPQTKTKDDDEDYDGEDENEMQMKSTLHHSMTRSLHHL
jgi:hypothetical protein